MLPDILNLIYKKQTQINYQDLINQYKNKKKIFCPYCQFISFKIHYCHLCNINTCNRLNCKCFCKRNYQIYYQNSIDNSLPSLSIMLGAGIITLSVSTLFPTNKYISSNHIILYRIPFLLLSYKMLPVILKNNYVYEYNYLLSK